MDINESRYFEVRDRLDGILADMKKYGELVGLSQEDIISDVTDRVYECFEVTLVKE